MKRYPCEETTLDILHGMFKVRLWVDNPSGGVARGAIVKAVNGVLKMMPQEGDPLTICEHIAQCGLQGIAAVQVIDSSIAGFQIGHMIYVTPFDA